MQNSDTFRARYLALQQNRPSVVAAGFWFAFLSFLFRLFFIVFLLGLAAVLIWALQIIPDDEMSFGQKLVFHSRELQLIAACFFVFGMMTTGFASRMSRRIVTRNVYIAELELLMEEMVMGEDKGD